ncbi:MAG: cobyrinate a,c-diamide synthase [Lachnospiraceae bacterium]|nr:cobyrinate a,c-diamide synthase [Lachnospiraceae bacterium]
MSTDRIEGNCPRIVLGAASSGSGKTLITCGLLQALKERGLQPASFKCGPDFIDPLFHETVLETPSVNLDTFFTDDETTRYLFLKHSKEADIALIEGVMGYYDGVAGTGLQASTYDAARVTESPVILIVNSRGMSLSVLACIRGFMEFRPDSRIGGVIFNQMSGMLYPRIREAAETELGIRCFGYVPVMEDMHLESRHLGLVLPNETEDLRERLHVLAGRLEETLDIDGILEMARGSGPMKGTRQLPENPVRNAAEKVRIAVSKDEAFCFLYRDNMELLADMGAEIVYFSPLHDQALPPAEGMILCGGYPELFAKELSENESMRVSIRRALSGGMPVLAECGGFMYLQQSMEDMDGGRHEMCGVLEGQAFRTNKAGRFGYISLTPEKDQLLGMDCGQIRGHEFHYYDSTQCGGSFLARKPLSSRSWRCMIGTETILAGFPHLYYYSAPKAAAAFLDKCRRFSACARQG